SAPDFLIARADVNHSLFGQIGHPEYFAYRFGQLAESLLALAQDGFGLFALGDISNGGLVQLGLALLLWVGHAAQFDDHAGSSTIHQRQFSAHAFCGFGTGSQMSREPGLAARADELMEWMPNQSRPFLAEHVGGS